MILDNFENQFNNNLDDIKEAYKQVHSLSENISKVIADYINESKEADNYKYLIIGRALNIAIYSFLTIKFNHTIEFTKLRDNQ